MVNESAKRRRRESAEYRAKELERTRKYQRENRSFCNHLCREWYRRNKDKKRAQRSAWSKRTGVPRIHSQRMRDALADDYVARVIAQGTILKPGDIPRVMIEAKRAQLKIRRMVYGKAKGHGRAARPVA
jgi:hypothetical protein